MAEFATLAAGTGTAVGLGAGAGGGEGPLLWIVPTGGFPPCMPFTLQATAVLLVPVTVAVNCWVAPAWTVPEVGEIVTVMGAVIVTIAEADFEESATLVVATVTVFGFGTVAGAV